VANHRALRGRTGHMVILHRRLVLPCFPAAESGPAAIGPGFCRLLPSEVAKYARAIQDGEDKPGWGARPGVKQSVVVLSPMIPGLGSWADNLDWRLWENGPFPQTEADVVIVWRPREILRRVRLADSARFLVEVAFGTGAVYHDVAHLWDMIEAQKTAQLRNRHAR
jgi:hypothetical protein